MHNNIELDQTPGFPLLTLTERMRDRSSRNVLTDPIIVEDVVVAVLDTMEGRLSPTEAMLLQEIAGLGRIIDQAKAEIAEVNVDSIRGRDIPSATGELDAIVEHTALATTSILESCETLDKLGETLTGRRPVSCKMRSRRSTRRAASRTSPASASPRSSGR